MNRGVWWATDQGHKELDTTEQLHQQNIQFSFLGLLPQDSSVTLLNVSFADLFTEPALGLTAIFSYCFLFSIYLDPVLCLYLVLLG